MREYSGQSTETWPRWQKIFREIVGYTAQPNENVEDILTVGWSLGHRRAYVRKRNFDIFEDLPFALSLLCYWPFKPELSEENRAYLMERRGSLVVGANNDVGVQERLKDIVSDEILSLELYQLYELFTRGDIQSIVRFEVVSKHKTIRVPLPHEEVVIERRPASGQTSDTTISQGETIRVPVPHVEVVIVRRLASDQTSDTTISQDEAIRVPISEGETIHVPISQEQVTVEKQLVKLGEVSLGKRQVQETQQASDTVRQEEAHIEREGNVNVQSGDVEGQ